MAQPVGGEKITFPSAMVERHLELGRLQLLHTWVGGWERRRNPNT